MVAASALAPTNRRRRLISSPVPPATFRQPVIAALPDRPGAHAAGKVVILVRPLIAGEQFGKNNGCQNYTSEFLEVGAGHAGGEAWVARVSDADLRLLRIFATVVDCKGFAAAQTELNLSAPSISSYIAALEQRLGVRLCNRGRGGFVVTDKGAIIYREAQRLFAAIEEFTAGAGAVRGRL